MADWLGSCWLIIIYLVVFDVGLLVWNFVCILMQKLLIFLLLLSRNLFWLIFYFLLIVFNFIKISRFHVFMNNLLAFVNIHHIPNPTKTRLTRPVWVPNFHTSVILLFVIIIIYGRNLTCWCLFFILVLFRDCTHYLFERQLTLFLVNMNDGFVLNFCYFSCILLFPFLLLFYLNFDLLILCIVDML